MLAKVWRPKNLARNWYLDHEKRLEDAIVAQEGHRDDDERHADGVRRLDEPRWR